MLYLHLMFDICYEHQSIIFHKKMIPMLVQKCHHLWWLHDENPIKALHIKIFGDHINNWSINAWWRHYKKFLKKITFFKISSGVRLGMLSMVGHWGNRTVPLLEMIRKPIFKKNVKMTWRWDKFGLFRCLLVFILSTHWY